VATTSRRTFSPIPAYPEKLERLIDKLKTAWYAEGVGVVVRVSYEFEDGGTDIRSIEPSEIGGLVPLAPPISMIQVRSPGIEYAALNIHVREGYLSLVGEAPTMSMAEDAVATAVAHLELTPYDPPAVNRIEDLEKRLNAVQAVQHEDVHLVCFLSYRFDAPDAAVATEVERFLRLQGVEVLTGRSYEPRRVEDKVRSRLSQGLDFVVYLLTSSGDSSWLRDEVAEARATQVPVIPLVEQGVEFDQGLFGNLERIEFAKGHIGDVWISLTEALAFIRAARRDQGGRP